jgi:hypothetical protein
MQSVHRTGRTTFTLKLSTISTLTTVIKTYQRIKSEDFLWTCNEKPETKVKIFIRVHRKYMKL